LSAIERRRSLYTAGRRGVGTTVIAEKITGAAAAAGAPLSHVAKPPGFLLVLD
jgi:dihydroxyacetone kinase